MHTESDDGVRLAYEMSGHGRPILFLHEFAGDHRSWRPQVQHFSGSYTCIVPAARGYPPSGVPTEPSAYSQDRAVADALHVLDAIDIERAVVVGNSMGAFAALLLAVRHPDRVVGAVVAGCGSGAHPDSQAGFRTTLGALADRYPIEGSQAVAEDYGFGPTRLPYLEKDPAGHAEHVRVLAEHDPLGAELTLRGVQLGRPSLYSLTDELAACVPPVLVVAGDEDDDVLDTNVMLKRVLPDCELAVLPGSGHLTNLEEPALFNQMCERLLSRLGW